MAKRTKTELTLIAEANRNPHRVIGIDHGVDRRRHFGVRRHGAMMNLVAAGIFEHVRSHGGTPLYKPGYGQSGVVYTSTFRLKDDQR